MGRKTFAPRYKRYVADFMGKPICILALMTVQNTHGHSRGLCSRKVHVSRICHIAMDNVVLFCLLIEILLDYVMNSERVTQRYMIQHSDCSSAGFHLLNIRIVDDFMANHINLKIIRRHISEVIDEETIYSTAWIQSGQNMKHLNHRKTPLPSPLPACGSHFNILWGHAYSLDKTSMLGRY